MSDTRERLIAENLHPSEPEIGYALFAMMDSRRRTHEVLDRLDEAAVDWSSPQFDHTIGTLLYHIAAIEVDWLIAEVLEGKEPRPGVWDWFPHEVRNAAGGLTIVKGVSLADHLVLLKNVRELLLDTFKAMTLADFHRPRTLDAYDVTPAWVLHHLCQHEAEHRMEIRLLRSAAEKAPGLPG